MRKISGFTLFEVLIAAVIFGLVILGLSSVFVAGNKHLIHTRERMTSAELGKFFLDPLQNQVRQDTWAASELGLAAGTDSSIVTQAMNNREFRETHVVAVVPDTSLRRVTSKISWTEPEA